MPNFTWIKNYKDGSGPTKAQLDAAFSSTEDFFNTTKLGSDNLQAAAATNALIGNLAVTTTKLANNAVTSAKLQSDGAVDANRAVTTNHIKDLAATTAKFAASVATKLKQVLMSPSSSSSATSSVGSASFTLITGVSCTITTTGRPVCIMFTPSSSGLSVTSNTSAGNANVQMSIQLKRDSTSIGVVKRILGGEAFWMDEPSAGTYTYQIYMATATGTSTITNSQLTAFEWIA